MVRKLVLKLAKKYYKDSINDIQAMELNQIERQEINWITYKEYERIIEL